MASRYKSAPIPPPDASGRVSVTLDGSVYDCAWSLLGDQLRVVSPVGQFHSGRRDPALAVEDQARVLLLEMWELIRSKRRGAG